MRSRKIIIICIIEKKPRPAMLQLCSVSLGRACMYVCSLPAPIIIASYWGLRAVLLWLPRRVTDITPLWALPALTAAAMSSPDSPQTQSSNSTASPLLHSILDWGKSPSTRYFSLPETLLPHMQKKLKSFRENRVKKCTNKKIIH